MKIFYAALFLFTCCSPAFAQKNLPDPGKVDLADLQLQKCPFEPSAAAMKLFDVQEVEFDPRDYKTILKTERRVRIKIFNENGYQYASVKIPYFSKKKETKIKSLTGVVYNLDASGKIVAQKLEKKDFFKEKSENNIGIVQFTFPNLKPGSIVEFSYTKIEKNVLQIDPWILQSEIPVAYAASSVIIPNSSRLRNRIFGTDTVTQVIEKLKGDRNKTTFFKENIGSFEPEPFMTSAKDNQLKVVFLLIPQSNFLVDLLIEPKTAWKFTGNILLDVFDEMIEPPIPGTEKLVDSALQIAGFENRLAFVFSKVQKQFSDNGEQTLYANNLAEAWTNKSANTAEMNLILLKLLKKSGIPSYPLLVSTRDHGKVNEDFPSLGQLNGVDVLSVDTGKYYVLDANLKHQSVRNPPFNVLNREGLLLVKDNIQWVNINDDRPLVLQNIDITTQMRPDGKIEGNAWIYYHDYAKSFALDSTDDDEKEDKFFDKTPIGLKILSVKEQNAEIDTEPLLKEMRFEFQPPNTNEYYFISPQFMVDKRENPFTKTTRNTDIDFGCNQLLTLKFQLDLADDFQVDHLPKSITVRAPDSSFFYKRTYSATKDSTVIFMSQFFEIKRSLFDKEEYSDIREFFNLIFPLMAEEIVVRKKK